MDNEIKSQPVVVTAVIQVTRADTGKVEEYTITGTAELPLGEQLQAQQQPSEA